MIFWIAMVILNTIALIAILVANRELERALRAMERFSSSRNSFREADAAKRSAAFISSQPSTARLCSEPSAGGMPWINPVRTASSPIASSRENSFGSTGILVPGAEPMEDGTPHSGAAGLRVLEPRANGRFSLLVAKYF